MDKYIFKLYITGQTIRSKLAIQNLTKVCEEELPGKYELVIIDTLEQPQIAEKNKVIATPTLIKEIPLPPRRVIGDMSDRDKVLMWLDIKR